MKKKIIFLPMVIIIFVIVFALCNIEIIKNWSLINKLKAEEGYNQTYKEKDLPEALPNDISYSAIRYKEISFNHPFGNVLPDNVEKENIFLMRYNGKDLGIQILAEKDGNRMNEVLNNNAKKLIANIYGEDIVKSDYSLMKKAFEITTDDLKIFRVPNKKLLANMWLFLYKYYYLPTNDGQILQFETSYIQGFQYNLHKEAILLEIYDSNGKAEYNYSILVRGDFKQKDIDIILTSIKFE